ncbi:uncharacterized protein [Macaca nemestrina]|uniref:uncharacterized protein isoform X2 n=1 Tax=Macaca nemestrina TaxID=9545 RepID=UPI0039B84C80
MGMEKGTSSKILEVQSGVSASCVDPWSLGCWRLPAPPSPQACPGSLCTQCLWENMRWRADRGRALSTLQSTPHPFPATCRSGHPCSEPPWLSVSPVFGLTVCGIDSPICMLPRLPSGRIATMSFDLTSSIPSPVPGTQQRRERAEQDGRIGTAPVSNSQREPHRRPVISAFSTEMKHLGRRVVKCHAGLVQTVSLASGL